MDKLKYERIGEANNRAEADVIESFLEAEGIDVALIEESVSYFLCGSDGTHPNFCPQREVRAGTRTA